MPKKVNTLNSKTMKEKLSHQLWFMQILVFYWSILSILSPENNEKQNLKEFYTNK